MKEIIGFVIAATLLGVAFYSGKQIGYAEAKSRWLTILLSQNDEIYKLRVENNNLRYSK